MRTRSEVQEDVIKHYLMELYLYDPRLSDEENCLFHAKQIVDKILEAEADEQARYDEMTLNFQQENKPE